MDMDFYQAEARRTQKPGKSWRDRVHEWGFGLAGEVGEILEPIKKMLHYSNPKPLDRIALKKEFGDALWYLASLAGEFDFTLSDIAESNLVKLAARHPERIAASMTFRGIPIHYVPTLGEYSDIERNEEPDATQEQTNPGNASTVDALLSGRNDPPRL